MHNQNSISNVPRKHSSIAEDIVGFRFGSLIVTKRSGNSRSGNARWTCTCDCGEWVLTTGTALRSGATKQCRRCSTCVMVGKRFGLFTVIAISGKSRRGRYVECLCDCGQNVTVLAQHVKDGLSTRCKYCGTVDLRGRRFGKLTVVDLTSKPAGRISGKAYWLCVCDCGGTKSTRTDYLRKGRTTSCGCVLIGRKSKTGYSAAWAQVDHKFRSQAESRNLPYELTIERSVMLARSDCHYCGIAPMQVKRIASGSVLFNGLDRLDSKQGYCEANVVPCCKHCNFAKNTMGYQEFREWVQRVYSHMFRAAVPKRKSVEGQLSLA